VIEGAAPDHADAVQRYFFDLVSKDELETLGAVFDRLLENVRREARRSDRASGRSGHLVVAAVGAAERGWW